MGLLRPLSLGLLGAAILCAALLGESAGRAASASIPAALLLCAAASALPGSPRRPALLVPAGILLASLALAAWRAPEPWAGRMALLEWGTGAALAAAMGVWGSSQAASRAASAVSAAAAALALYALWQWGWGLALVEAACRADPALAGVGPGASEVLRGLLSSRLGTREPFGTFALSNTLAGLMLLGLPLLAGLAADRARQGRKGASALLAALGLCCGLALLLTRSKGAWLALAAAALAWGLRRAPRRVLVACAATAVLLMGWRLSAGGGMSHSASFRLGYWAGAGNLVLERPWGGSGLGGFEAHYGRVRPVWARDVRRAHCEPLQLWAEAGIWAVAGALWLGWACRRGKAEAVPALPASDARGWGWAAGALALLVLLGVPGVLHEAMFPGPLPRILLALGMSAAAGLAAWASEGGWGSSTVAGIRIGTAALAVHALGDLDLGISGTALAFWALTGALAASSPGEASRPARGGAAVRVALALSALLFLSRSALPWIEAEGAVDAAGGALLRRPGPLGEGTYRDLRASALGVAARAEAWALLGDAEERRWRAGDPEAFSLSLGARARAAALSPSGAAVRESLSRLCLEGAERDPRLAGEALRWIDAAVESFPTAPRLRVRAAQVRRELRGVPALASAAGKDREALGLEADALYRGALDLDDRVGEPNLRLSREARAEAEAWITRRP